MPIVASYPNQVASFSTKFDLTDIVFAAHINALQAEVVALESVIGTLPQGTAATVRDRIAALEAAISVLNARFDGTGKIPESGVTNLPADLANRSLVGHGHAEGEITNLLADLNGKAALTHTHAESAITGLLTDLGNRSMVGHGHSESDIASLVGDLGNRSLVGHTHAYMAGSGTFAAGVEITATTDGTGRIPIRGLTFTPVSAVATYESSSGTSLRRNCKVANKILGGFDVYIVDSTTGSALSGIVPAFSWMAWG